MDFRTRCIAVEIKISICNFNDLFGVEMAQQKNLAEEFVYNVCNHSFLSLWSLANPRRTGSDKELCDILIVCDPHIIIFSVKDIKVNPSKEPAVEINRWRKRAIEKSSKQIYGAERHIKSSSHVMNIDGTYGIQFPRSPSIHRVAVALGSQGQMPIEYGDFGKGFIHVFDELSFSLILAELDTISDFVEYLCAKEDLYSSGTRTIHVSGEEDLLAVFLSNDRMFPFECDSLVIDHSQWKNITHEPWYNARKRADSCSYIWDALVDALCKDILRSKLTSNGRLPDIEMAIRAMARENRYNRRFLGQEFSEFIENVEENKVKARMVPSYSGVTYIFLMVPKDVDRDLRQASLANRCFIARGLNPANRRVVGIGMDETRMKTGSTSDIVYRDKEKWTAADQSRLEAMQKDLGYFLNSKGRRIQEEYPI